MDDKVAARCANVELHDVLLLSLGEFGRHECCGSRGSLVCICMCRPMQCENALSTRPFINTVMTALPEIR
jgi:hypothetical protein